jgi:hypothetical protein
MALQSFIQTLLGYDIFISHRWSEDSTKYAFKLKEQLEKRGLDCFVDQTNLPKGESIPGSITRAITRSTMFVVICSEDVLESIWIPRELKLAAKKGRKIVPINLSGALDKFPLDVPPWNSLKDRNRVEETTEAFNAQTPSANVAMEIDQAFTARRQRVRAIRSLLVAGVIFFAVSLGAVGAAGYAWKVRDRLTREANILRGEITTTRTEAEQARQEKASAEAARNTAVNQKLAAEGERDTALGEKESAQKVAGAAKTELFNATADRLAAEAATMGKQLGRNPEVVLTALESLRMRWSADAQKTALDSLKLLRTPIKLVNDGPGVQNTVSIVSPKGNLALFLKPGPVPVLNVYDVAQGKQITSINGKQIVPETLKFLDDELFIAVIRKDVEDTLTVWRANPGDPVLSEKRADRIEAIETDPASGEVVLITKSHLEVRNTSDDSSNPALYKVKSWPISQVIEQVALTNGLLAAVECESRPGLIKKCQVRVWEHDREVATKQFDEVPLIAFANDYLISDRIRFQAHAPFLAPVLATVAHGTMEFWTGQAFEISLYRIGVGRIRDVIFSPRLRPNAERFFVTVHDNAISVWKINQEDNAVLVKEFTQPNEELYSWAFSPDGKTVASAYGNAAIVWDVQEPFTLIDSVIVHDGAVRNVAFVERDPGRGERIVTTSLDGTAVLWGANEERPDQDLSSPKRLAPREIERLAGRYFTRSISLGKHVSFFGPYRIP